MLFTHELIPRLSYKNITNELSNKDRSLLNKQSRTDNVGDET